MESFKKLDKEERINEIRFAFKIDEILLDYIKSKLDAASAIELVAEAKEHFDEVGTGINDKRKKYFDERREEENDK